jgi:hypothetical protein
MAGTVTPTYTKVQGAFGTHTLKTAVAWTSDTSGDATGTINFHGFLIKVITDPGSVAPSDNYDLSLVADGIDQLGGLLVDRDTANNELVYPVVSGASTPIFLAGDHTFTIANAGSTKNGVVYFYLRES